MYADVAWVLVSLGTQVQSQIILDPNYLPDYPSVSYNYDFTKRIGRKWRLMQTRALQNTDYTRIIHKIQFRSSFNKLSEFNKRANTKAAAHWCSLI